MVFSNEYRQLKVQLTFQRSTNAVRWSSAISQASRTEHKKYVKLDDCRFLLENVLSCCWKWAVPKGCFSTRGGSQVWGVMHDSGFENVFGKQSERCVCVCRFFFRLTGRVKCNCGCRRKRTRMNSDTSSNRNTKSDWANVEFLVVVGLSPKGTAFDVCKFGRRMIDCLLGVRPGPEQLKTFRYWKCFRICAKNVAYFSSYRTKRAERIRKSSSGWGKKTSEHYKFKAAESEIWPKDW